MENANEFLLYLQKCRVVNIQMYNEKVLIYLMFVYLFVGSWIWKLAECIFIDENIFIKKGKMKKRLI